MRTTKVLAICAVAAGTSVSSGLVLAGACGHDVHGSPTIEVTELGEGTSVMHYFSPATIIMDDAKDPRHRAFGECRGQAVMIDGVANWEGACIWSRVEGDGAYVAYWTAKPGDKGVERRDALHGTARLAGTGRLAYLNDRTASWTGLANGGSRFCDD